LSKGYSKGELYVTTWGTGNEDDSSKQTHSKEYLEYLRAFTEAVIAYTGASKIDIIGHSMGVTLGRRVIKGGRVNSDSFDLGVALTNKVDAFVGIAGANWGLTTCYELPMYQTCNNNNGFYPGYMAGPVGLSDYLSELNNDKTREGSFVASILST
jgi:triacylglycerol lipase